MGRISDIPKLQKKYKTEITENIVKLNYGDVFEIGRHRLIYGNSTDKNIIAKLNYGDVFEIGRHRLIYGNSTDKNIIAKLMDDKLANMIFTDPPFNLKNEKVGSIASSTDFITAGGEMTTKEFTEFLTKIANNLYDFSVNNSIHYICINWRNIAPLLDATKIYNKFKSLIIWNKCNAGISGFYRNQYELIFVFQKGKNSCIQNFSFKDYRTNIWNYNGQSSFCFAKKARYSAGSSDNEASPISD